MRALLAAAVLFAVGLALIASGADSALSLGVVCWAGSALALVAAAGSIARRIRRVIR